MLESTYELTQVEDWVIIEDTIKKVQNVLWFKKIIAFSWWWSGVKVESNDLQKKISSYSDELKYHYVDSILKWHNFFQKYKLV